MTKIDFYIASTDEADGALTIACRLVEKAWRRGHAIYVHTPSPQMSQTFDDLLWSFRPNSFIPHRLEQNNENSPANIPDILIGCQGESDPHHEILVNLTEQTPTFFSRFMRVAEIVNGNDAAKAKSRERYKYYRTRGYPLDVHHL